MDLLSRRFTGLFVKAGNLHRPLRNDSLAREILSASVGLATPHLLERLDMPLAAVLYHAGGLAGRTRSAERLRGLLTEETGLSVTIEEFAGRWVEIPSSEQSRLPIRGQRGQYHALGVDAIAGARTWDPSARFLVRLGPLPWEAFRQLLPGSPLHQRIASLTRLQVGVEQQFALAPVLQGADAPTLRLGAMKDEGSGAGRLGWSSWLTTAVPRQRDLVDALLSAEAPRNLVTALAPSAGEALEPSAHE